MTPGFQKTVLLNCAPITIFQIPINEIKHRVPCGPVQPFGSRRLLELFYVSDLGLYAACHMLLNVSIPANPAIWKHLQWYILPMAVDNMLE